jgi:hypothetical protein
VQRGCIGIRFGVFILLAGIGSAQNVPGVGPNSLQYRKGSGAGRQLGSALERLADSSWVVGNPCITFFDRRRGFTFEIVRRSAAAGVGLSPDNYQ